MDKQDRQYIAATKRWIKSQELSIESCDISIKQARQHIDLSNRIIKAETAERLMKVSQLKEVKKNLAKYK